MGLWVGVGVGLAVGLGLGVVGRDPWDWGSHLTLLAWLQHLQPGSNLSPLGHFLTMGALDEQTKNELHFGSDGFGTIDPILLELQGFPVKMER